MLSNQILKLKGQQDKQTIREEAQKKKGKQRKVRKQTEEYAASLLIRSHKTQAIKAALRISANLKMILNLMEVEDKVKVLLMKRLKRKRKRES